MILKSIEQNKSEQNRIELENERNNRILLNIHWIITN